MTVCTRCFRDTNSSFTADANLAVHGLRRSSSIRLRSKTNVVLACVNKSNSELSSHQKKIFKVDDHIGLAIAGLTADGRVLSRYMRSECINYSFTYE